MSTVISGPRCNRRVSCSPSPSNDRSESDLVVNPRDPYNMVGASGQACERCKGGNFWQVIAEGCYAGGRGAATVLAFEAYLHRWLKTYEKCVDLFLAPSEFVKQTLIENGWDGAQIRVLPHFQHSRSS